MTVYYRSGPASIFHDGVLHNGKLVAKCAVNSWRERADWLVQPGRATNCQHCLRLRRLEAEA